MLVVLGLIDVVMISNLLIMVIIGGYETFVSRLGAAGHPDQPEWLSHVNASVLKVKLAMAIIGISSIHLLRTFIDAGNVGSPESTGYTETGIILQTVIHAFSSCRRSASPWSTGSRSRPPTGRIEPGHRHPGGDGARRRGAAAGAAAPQPCRGAVRRPGRPRAVPLHPAAAAGRRRGAARPLRATGGAAVAGRGPGLAELGDPPSRRRLCRAGRGYGRQHRRGRHRLFRVPPLPGTRYRAAPSGPWSRRWRPSRRSPRSEPRSTPATRPRSPWSRRSASNGPA